MASAASIMATSPRVSIIPSASPMLPPWPRPFGPCSAVSRMTLNRGGLGVKCVLRAPEAVGRAEMLRMPGDRAGDGAVAGHERVAHVVPHQVRGRGRRGGGALTRGDEQ